MNGTIKLQHTDIDEYKKTLLSIIKKYGLVITGEHEDRNGLFYTLEFKDQAERDTFYEEIRLKVGLCFT